MFYSLYRFLWLLRLVQNLHPFYSVKQFVSKYVYRFPSIFFAAKKSKTSPKLYEVHYVFVIVNK